MSSSKADEGSERTVKVHLEPRDTSLGKKLIISVAPTGDFSKRSTIRISP